MVIDFLNWQSSLSARTVFEGAASSAYPHIFGDGTIYLGTDKLDRGRSVIMYHDSTQEMVLTPPPFAVRSGICEYGGKAFWINGGELFFIDQKNQCIYRLDLKDSISSNGSPAPQRVSPLPNDGERFMYTDLNFINNRFALAIIERESAVHKDTHIENESFIGLLSLNTPEKLPRKLASGSDFHSNLCVDLANKSVAWVQWDHPNMPWDNTQLMLAGLDSPQNDAGSTTLSDVREVQLGSSASVCQLIFANNGTLFYSADFADRDEGSPENFWNIYAIPDLESANMVTVSEATKEFGYPHWQYGNARIVQLNETQLLTIASSPQGDEVFLINQDSLEIVAVTQTDCGFENLSSDGGGRAMALMLSQQELPQLVLFGPDQTEFLAVESPPSLMDKQELSSSQHFEFECSDGAQSYGYYYLPMNSAYSVDDFEKCQPPLLVMVHGGPTARADGYFDIQKQFWTQRGFAIFDVNHRGSCGYGRQYRDALYGLWGERDCQDIVDGIGFLIANEMADPDRICIRGKSAGGYAVLRALTEHPQVFKAGASYYGIGNLVTLAETTHKFEKHYTDRLIGEAYNPISAMRQESEFYKRSPIHKLDRLASAMIVFQGGLDKIVPPSVAHEVIDTLKALNLDYSYVEYAEEGHGFRNSENNIDAWTKELEFYYASMQAG